MAVKNVYQAKRRGHIMRQRKRMMFVVTEGKNKSEETYLRHLESNRLKIHFVKSSATDPENMARALVSECVENDFNPNFDLGYSIFDTDFAESKNIQIKNAQKIIDRQKLPLQLIISSPCYEIWYICHFIYSGRQYCSNDEVIGKLKEFIPDYDKSDDVFDALLEKQETAIKNAKKLEEASIAAKRERHTTDFTPSTEIYKVVCKLNEINLA